MGDTALAHLSTRQRDRAAGVLLGVAAGDGLGGPDPGAWSGVTAQAIAVAELAATGADLRRADIAERIVARWNWFAQTVGDPGGPTPVAAAPVALSNLDDETALMQAAYALNALRVDDPAAGQAGVLWGTAIRHAVLTGRIDARIGLGHFDDHSRRLWLARIAEAEATPPAALAGHGPIGAVQRAWSAITRTGVPAEDPGAGVFRVDHLRRVLDAAPRDGAALAGGLLGAAYGATAVPAAWRLRLRGWPGLRARDLIGLADTIIGPEETANSYWTTRHDPPPRRHPHDDGVYIGGVGALAQPSQYVPAGVDAMVSLSAIPNTFLRTDAAHLDVRLRESDSPNLDFVLLDTVRVIEALRAAGRTVFVHGLRGRGRTATVAALYGARRSGIGCDDALADMQAVLPDANPGSDFRDALHRLGDAA